jgi:hypothetical protein
MQEYLLQTVHSARVKSKVAWQNSVLKKYGLRPLSVSAITQNESESLERAPEIHCPTPVTMVSKLKFVIPLMFAETDRVRVAIATD